VNGDDKEPKEKYASEEESLERVAYLEERKSLVEGERESAQSLDKSLITLSAGALGLSITFIRQIAPDPELLGLLYVGWGGFGLSLLAVLMSLLVSQLASRSARDNLDRLYSGQEVGDLRNRWGAATNALNFTSILSFVIGVAFLATFAVVNVAN
jgi:hypothetical protein